MHNWKFTICLLTVTHICRDGYPQTGFVPKTPTELLMNCACVKGYWELSPAKHKNDMFTSNSFRKFISTLPVGPISVQKRSPWIAHQVGLVYVSRALHVIRDFFGTRHGSDYEIKGGGLRGTAQNPLICEPCEARFAVDYNQISKFNSCECRNLWCVNRV